MTSTMNERSWSGQIIAWIKTYIEEGNTIFEDVTNDEGIKVDSGITKFPDILLFRNKTSGIVFNGWELKFPDTDVDDQEMLKNALEKAQVLKSNSFVTWNGKTAIIWKILDENYSVESLERLKTYPNESGINRREDLSERSNYIKNEGKLKSRLINILHDLEILYENGVIKDAINISSEIMQAISKSATYIIPQLQSQIVEEKNNNQNFRDEFNKWKIIENSTIKIMSNSSREEIIITEEEILAKFTFYKLIGRIIFYETLSWKLSGCFQKIVLNKTNNIKEQLDQYFSDVQKVDYQAVFEKDFTDCLKFNEIINQVIFNLIEVLSKYDFAVLPNEVIGNILHNLIPKNEKQRFGQYFTPEKLAYLVAFPAITNKDCLIFDPTSGSGTFLDISYKILKYFGKNNHQELLSQIWGNDISQFPAVLSVINLYKQDVTNIDNFPRVTHKDYFNIEPRQNITLPDNKDPQKTVSIEIPIFDSIVSNFPFIQQEDIPNDRLTRKFATEFGETQQSFITGEKFNINERSDYYIYCFYNSLKFLKDNGRVSVVTSNAWLGKNYGQQFKNFLLDNFSIKYIFQSNAEHWFKTSQVRTIFVVLVKDINDQPTKFVTLNKKLDDIFQLDSNLLIKDIDNFYNQIDYCDDKRNEEWEEDFKFPNTFINKDGSLRVSIISRELLTSSIQKNTNWSSFFIAPNLFSNFESKMILPYPSIFNTWRGTRTGQNKMFVLNQETINMQKIEPQFLIPEIKHPKEIKQIFDDHKCDHYMFVCNESEEILARDYPHSYEWIKKWENEKNDKGVTLKIVFGKNKPYWYSKKPEKSANIYFPINPNERLFFSYASELRFLDQRLIALKVNQENAALICALLNSIITLLEIEMNGVQRNLGALDLNADFFKKKIRILDPNLLDKPKKERILKKFNILSTRQILPFEEEYRRSDRLHFDEAIFECYGLNKKTIPDLYEIFIQLIKDRIEMKNK